MAKLNSGMGKTALVVGHVAGMTDLVALALWVDTLIEGYHYKPAQAGAMPSLFLLGAVIGSVLLSRKFNSLPTRVLSPVGYWVSAAAMLAVPHVGLFGGRLALHLVAGMATGVGVSCVHGSMGQTDNPHRIFAAGGIGLGIFGIIFLGGVPQLINGIGAQGFFIAVAVMMAVAGVVTTLFMPSCRGGQEQTVLGGRLPRSVWNAVFGVTGLALVQGMTFSFLVQSGSAHGFSAKQVEMVLIALGIVNLFPPVIAAALEKKLNPMSVAKVGPLVHALLALAIMTSPVFLGFAIPSLFFAAMMIFTHTFVFGFIAEQDPSGRAVAATPAMLMIGSGLGPFLGGSLVQMFGFPGIGIAAVVVAIIAISLFARAERAASKDAAKDLEAAATMS